MKTLIKLELKKNKIRPYAIASIIIAIVMLGFLYLFAYIPALEPDDARMKIFLNYNTIIPLFAVLNMAAFGVLAAVMYSKFIVEEYSGKRAILLLSYPVSRKKVMLAKLVLVGVYTILSMVVSNLIIFSVFGISERFFPLVLQEFTQSIILQAAWTTIFMSLIAVCAGIIAAGIGFIKKSVPTTIISAILIACLFCNITANTISNQAVMVIFAILLIFTGFFISIMMMKKADAMEV